MSNPMIIESGLEKLKNKFIGKREEPETSIGSINTFLVGTSRGVDICAEACACCWDKQIPDDYAGRAEYIGKRTRTGHTSILEHSNFVIYMKMPEGYLFDLTNFLTWSVYLHTKIEKLSDGTYGVLIGSTYRGFREIFYHVDDIGNAVYKAFIGALYVHAPSAAFEDFFDIFLNKNSFIDAEPDPAYVLTTMYEDPDADTDYFKIVGMDSINILMHNMMVIDPEFAKKLDTHDLINFVSVTVMFKNMSRTCTHQAVRHRDAVTQESQRYVDYSEAKFSNPAIFKPGKYDIDHKYTVRFGTSGPLQMTLDEIGEAMTNIYGMLSNPTITGGKYALLKEDARGYLPGNIQCRKLYMTFTYKMLFAFLKLREANGAQAEIRMYARMLGNWFRDHSEFKTKDITDTYTMPKMCITDPMRIDVDMGFNEETVDMSADMTEAQYLEYMNKCVGTDTTSEEPTDVES